ncbi:uncharacterized protein LOC120642573 [Panicum virgatum]|uniref:Uncharacterized protein n=1 Tax=Panicum virgatum TaxID=38727 RepID=A0A8T0QL65_PANVG|nr:uncharacterized protein LOC120642573 [Panicum virgatum]KAG2573502.1 hypothetical protein PVAP13_7KG257300 [Panicum virgatum]
MKSSGVVLVLLLAIATASCRHSLAAAAAAADAHESGASIPAILGRELRGFIARAGNIFRSAGGGAWRAANATASASAAEAKNLRAVAAARRRRPAARKSAAGCVSAAACRKRRVICAKRCYRASRAAAGLTHVPSRCVVKCRKCVPTC